MKEYKCNRCDKIYTDASNYNKHINNKKLCGSKTTHIQQELENQIKLKTLEEQNLEKGKEIQRLHKLLEESKFVRDMKEELKEGFKELKDSVKTIGKKIDENAEISNLNNCVFQNQNNLNNNLNFSMKLSAFEKERYDHIVQEQMLHILNDPNFVNSVGDVADAVFFNPKAPENLTWCVTDKNAQFGALEYDAETNTIVRTLTLDVIIKHLHSLLYGVTDRLNKLRDECPLNEQQAKNCDKFYEILGSETFHTKYINIVKSKAYEGRNLTKAVWEKLHLSIEKTALRTRVVPQKIKII
jgi:hypothetical protein